MNSRLRLFTYLVLAYMLLAFVWWSILLHTKNRDAFDAKVGLQQLGMAAEGRISSPAEYFKTDNYLEMQRLYKRQEYMILGETLFLVLSLLGGMYIIHRGYQREVLASQQQRNFLLSITHELKSPLAGLRLSLQTLAKRAGQLTPVQTNQLTASGLQEADRLQLLVEDLLLSARLETAFQLHKTPVNLHALCEKAINRMQQRNPEGQWLFHNTTDDATLDGDENALNSILYNLLENAAKYSPPPCRVNLTLKEENRQLVLEIIDEGIGVPAAEKGKIFRKFYRVGNEDTRQTKGTGLGLFIVAELVRAHGGSIALSDNQPRGSRFTIRLPRH